MPRATSTYTPSTPRRAIHTPPLAYAAPPLIQAVQPDDELARLLARHRHLDAQLADLSEGATAISDDAERAEQVHMIDTAQRWMRERITALGVLATVAKTQVRLAA